MFKPMRVALILAGLAGLACSGVTPTPVPPEKTDYVGSWSGGPVTLTIEANGMLHYKKESGGTSSSLDAPIQLWHSKGFDAGIGLLADLTRVGLANLLRLEVAFPDDGSGTTVIVTSTALF